MPPFGKTGISLLALVPAGVLGLCPTGWAVTNTISPGAETFSAALGTLSPGDELHLNAGDYTESGSSSSSAVTIPGGVVVRGLGAGPGDVRILRTYDSKQVVSSGATAGNRSTVTNMSFYRAGAGLNTPEIHSSLVWLTVQNCIFDGTNVDTGVAVGQGVFVKGTTLEGVEIRNMLNRGVYGEGTTETNIIRNCNVHHNDGIGIEVPDGQTPVTVISGGTVAANTNNGVYMWGAPAQITGCTVVSNLEYGIRLYKAGANGSIVSNCTVEYNGYMGVYFSDTSNCKVKDSRANFNGVLGANQYQYAGIGVSRSDNCEISGNTCSNNAAIGGSIGSDGNIFLRQPDGVVARGNTLAGGGPHYGFFVWEGGPSDIAIIEQNVVFGHSRYGIRQEANGATILSTSNLYYQNSQHGLRPEGIITSRWDTLWANGQNGAQADGASAVLDIRNSLVISNNEAGLQEGTFATVVSDYNDVFGNGINNYSNLVAGANDVSVDPVFYSVDPTSDCFLYLSWKASPASVTTGSDVGNQMGARPVCPASIPHPQGTVIVLGSFAGPGAGGNLILNGGFEEPFDVGLWQGFGLSATNQWLKQDAGDDITRVSNGHSGDYCLRADLQQGGGVIYQVPAIAVGECHRLEFWVIAEAGQARVRAEGGIPGIERIAGATWQKVGIVFEAGIETIQVWLEPQDSTAVIRIDDVSLEQIPCPLVRGTVFDDLNTNGTLDVGEPGISNVQVNAATRATLTESDGTYEIGAIPGKFVFVTKPAGWRIVTQFFARLPESMPAPLTVDFALAADPTEPTDNFSFLEYNDLHLQVPVPGDTNDQLFSTSPADTDAAIATLNNMYPAPRFTVDVGDMVNWGTDAMLTSYAARLPSHERPIWPVVGNHEVLEEGPSNFANYEEWVGPLYYSFDYGRYHFIARTFSADTFQERWFDRDVALNEEKPKIFFTHYVRSWGTFVRLEQVTNALAVFSGHWHTDYAFHFGNMAFYSAASFVRAGGSASPPSFRYVTLSNDVIETSQRVLGVDEVLDMVFPANGSTVETGVVALKVNAYDTDSLLDQVTASIDGGPAQQLAALNAWTWTAPLNLTTGAHTLAFTAIAGARNWSATGTVTAVTNDLPDPQMGTPWPTFQGDSRRSGRSLDTVGPPLALAWVANVGARTALSSPVVYDDRVYVGVEDTEKWETSGVTALDIATGALLWRAVTDAPVRHTVAAQSNKVFALTSNGEILAINATNGATLWTYDIPGPWERKIQSPALVQNGVFLGGSQREFVALDIQTGGKLWSYSAVSKGGDVGYSCEGPAAVGNTVVGSFASGSPPLRAWDIPSGQLSWSSGQAARYTSPVALTQTNMLVSDVGGRLYILDRTNGAEVADMTAGSAYSVPVVHSNAIIVSDNESGAVRSLDFDTGAENWNFQSQAAVAPLVLHKIRGPSMMSSPVLSGGVVYVGSDDGWFYALDANSGSLLWSHEIGVPIASSAAVSGNAVFVAALDGNVYAFVTK